MFATQLLIGSAMVALTVVIHTLGLAAEIVFLRPRIPKATAGEFVPIVRTLVVTVLGLFLLHTVEIWCWAVLYIGLGEFSDLEDALYFSTVTFTTLGYGDITLREEWRLLSAFEAANGIILFGVSTAFLFAAIQRTYHAVFGEK